MRWLALLPLFMALPCFSQVRCGTDLLPQNLNQIEKSEELQQWISDQISLRPERKAPHVSQAPFEVPVVFHIIHNGEPIGTGANLPDSRIEEQLQILNEDFRRQNADASLTPAEYLSVAADVEINFVQAKRGPEGLPTSGITRTQGPRTTYPDDAKMITAIIQWPPEQVVNIYVVPLASSLGFAKFPFSSLSGITSEINRYRDVDGIFVDYRYFGLNDDPDIDFESKGRTVTHEMGHYFGLLHIFNGCGTGDYCDDTPSQQGSTNGCPAEKTSCNSPDMIQNYLDYTDDACMNLFTQCQRDRMQVVLQSSPRRASLLTSPMLQDPIQVVNDLGIKEIVSPKRIDCEATFVPEVAFRNTGTTAITSFTAAVIVNGSTVGSKTTSGLTLNPLDIASVTFDPLNLNAKEINTVQFQITQVNGTADGNAENNLAEVVLPAAEANITPYFLNFDSPVVVQAETETGTETRWEVVTAPNVEAQNLAIKLDGFNNPANYGITDYFYTALVDVSNLSSLLLNFKYAYAQNANGTFLDGLVVAVSQDCGETFSIDNIVFERTGTSLPTATATNVAFVPTGDDDWEQISLNLTPYLNGHNLQIAFGGVNGGGNNLFIDEIELTSGELPARDARIRTITNLSPVTCRDKVFPRLTIRNFGYQPIQSFKLLIRENGQDTLVQYSDLNIVSGAIETFSNLSFDLQAGKNDFDFFISDLNGLDEATVIDSLSLSVTLNEDTDVLPFKETFTDPTWTIEGPSEGSVFKPESFKNDPVLVAFAYDSGAVGSENYLVSPVFKTGKYTEAAIRFRYSYAYRPGYTDQLSVVLSNDCGANYNLEVKTWTSTTLSTQQSLDPWIPQDDSDWQTGFVDISEHMIWSSLRAALVFKNGNGNNLYLDDVEVILNNDPDLPRFEQRFEVYPIPAVGRFYVAMNLPERETVRIRLIDMAGKAVLDQNFTNTLNQTYELIAPTQRGFYILQVIGEQVYQYRRIFIDQ